MITIKGDSPNEKIKHIEVILNRMSRRLAKVVIGVMPPVPIMFAAEVPLPNGEIFAFLAPAKGMITDICLLIRDIEGSAPVAFEATATGVSGGSHAKFSTKKNLSIQTLDLVVNPGDLLSLKTESPEKLKGIWLSFLYQMGIDKLEQKTFMIEEFNKIVEEESNNASE